MKNMNKKIIFPVILLVIGLWIFIFNNSDVLAGLFFGIGLTVLTLVLRGGTLKPTTRYNTTRMKRCNTTRVPAIDAGSGESRLQQKAEETVAAITAAALSTPLGAEYRKEQWIKTDTVVNGMLDMFMTAVASKIPFCTIAVFFPAKHEGYYMQRYISKTEFVNKNAHIIPRRGILGSFIAEELRPFYESNLPNNKNATLYYYDENHDFKPEESIRSILLSPITAAGETRGILLADNTKENAFSEEDHTFLNNIAALIGQSVYYTYMNTEHSLDYHRLTAISSVEKDFWKELEFDAVMDKICNFILSSIPCDRLTISLKEEDKMTASVVRAYGENAQGLHKLEFRLDSDNAKSIAPLAYSKELGFFRNLNEERYEFRYCEEEPKHKEFASFMAVPFGVDKLKGLMLIESVRRDVFTTFNLDLLSRIGTSAGLALEKIFILRQAENLATHDGLTGLYNHRQFQKILTTKISACSRRKDQLSLVLCDIDFFKKLNDTYGHPFGDVVLKGVAARLENSIRIDVDAAARYGGEEFVLILEADHNTAKESVERIRLLIESLVFKTTDGEGVKTSMSFGIASFPHHARDIDEIIGKADKALYAAKKNGRNRVEVWTLNME